MRNLQTRFALITWLDSQMYEVDDDVLSTWLMEGVPNGADKEEIMEWCAEDDTYLEWLELGMFLLRYRDKETEFQLNWSEK